MVDDPASRRRLNLRKIARAYRDAQQILSMCLMIAVSGGLGYWLDQRYGWQPALTVAGVGLGLAAAGLSLARMLRESDGRRRSEGSKQSGRSE